MGDNGVLIVVFLGIMEVCFKILWGALRSCGIVFFFCSFVFMVFAVVKRVFWLRYAV